MATLLPNAVQQFFDANGNPLADGTVTFYVPNSTVPKDTWQDSGATILNTNPLQLDAAGEAVIYGTGIYRQIVKDINGNLIWDGLTADTAAGGLAWGGISGGTPNAQTIAPSSFSSQDGQQISFIAGLTNTSQLTVNGIAVLNDTVNGPAPLTGGEVVEDNAVTLIYDAPRGAFHIVNPTAITDDKIANSFKAKIVGSVANRAALALLNGAAYLSVNLREAGRQGIFTWSSANLSASVSADAVQGLYVAPSSDPSGATGAWVRQYSGRANVRWFGAVADGVTNDVVAIQTAINLTNSAYIPNGNYSCTSAVVVTDYTYLEFESQNAIITANHSGAGIEGKDKGTDRHFFVTISSGRVTGGGTTSYGIDFTNITYGKLLATFITACANGWRNGGTTGISAYYNEAHGATISTCGVGVINGTLGNETKMFGGSIKDCGVCASDDNNSGTLYDGVAMETFTAFGSRISNNAGATFVRIANCRFENPSTTGPYASAVAIRVAAASLAARIRDNYITSVATGLSDSGTGTEASGN